MKQQTETTLTEKKLHIFAVKAKIAGGDTETIVGGTGETVLEAMGDAAEKLHVMGFRDVALTPRDVSFDI